MLNSEVFENVKKSGKKILVVTKYHSPEKTRSIIEEVEKDYLNICIGYGENRVEHLREKNIAREKLHFIGNIQSRKIPEIVKYCSVIHSLTSLEHAQKIEKIGQDISVFLQIHLDDKKDSGIPLLEIPNFLEKMKDFSHIHILGISAIGSEIFDEGEKRKEFQILKKIRDTYIPNGAISAGTSRDYVIALGQGVDIVRVGEKILTDI